MAEVKLINDQQYPSNSRMAQQNEELKTEKVEAVVSGKTYIQKQSFGEKIKKIFLPGDIKDIKNYAINQVIIPGIQNGILAMVEMAFFGKTRGNWYNPNRSYYSGYNQTNYSYVSSNPYSPQRSSYTMTQGEKSSHNFRNIIFETYDDAEEVISTMLEILSRSGIVTVANFYECCRQPSSWVDGEWGWRSFQKLEPRAIRGGYIIDMTPPVYLK